MLALYWDTKIIWVVTIGLTVLLVCLERRQRKKKSGKQKYDHIEDRAL